MAVVSSYIFEILDDEIYDVQSKLLDRVAAEYKLDAAELKKKFLTKKVRVTPNADTRVEVIRKNHCGEVSPEQRCIARIATGQQCTRGRCKDHAEFCRNHTKQLPHGKITDPMPEHMKKKERRALYTA